MGELDKVAEHVGLGSLALLLSGLGSTVHRTWLGPSPLGQHSVWGQALDGGSVCCAPGFTGDMGVGSQQVPMALLWESKVALQPRQREAQDGMASRPEGGWADTQRGQPPGTVKGRPSRQGGAPSSDGADKA